MPGKRAEGVKIRKFGADDELWEAALAKAHGEGRSASEVIRELLRGYLSEGQEPPRAPRTSGTPGARTA